MIKPSNHFQTNSPGNKDQNNKMLNVCLFLAKASKKMVLIIKNESQRAISCTCTSYMNVWRMDSSRHLQSPSSNRPRRLCKNLILHLEAVYLHAKDDQLQVYQRAHQGLRPHTRESACGGAVQPKSDLSRLCRFLSFHINTKLQEKNMNKT